MQVGAATLTGGIWGIEDLPDLDIPGGSDMSLTGIANRTGVSIDSLRSLVDGVVPPGIANRLGISNTTLQEFVDGQAAGMVVHFGVSSAASQEFRDLIGREGAIGLLIGMLLEKGRR